MTTNLVLLGLDSSTGAQRAAEWAARHGSQTGAEILAGHVLTYSKELARDLPPSGLTNWRRRLQQELRSTWTEPLRAAGVPFRTQLIEDDTVEGGLLRLADEADAELIVLGAQGVSSFTHRLLGSVSYKVAHASHRPVVIVPPDWKVDPAVTDR